MRQLFSWIYHCLAPASRIQVGDNNFEARAVARRVAKGGVDGLSAWRVVIQLRHPEADYDGVYQIEWIAKTPPDVAEVFRHYQSRPEDFRFLDFRPNLNKQPRPPGLG